jgi:hypothetical protein
MKYDEAMYCLTTSKGNLRCLEVVKILESLGFTVKAGKNFNHKGFTHEEIKNFRGGTFNCGHGKNPQVNKHYLENIISILKKYEDKIRILGY